MSLIKSISGIRGTIGGQQGEGLNPLDIVKFTAAFATVIRENIGNKRGRIVVGRDARLSGEMLYQCVSGTLVGMGFDVINIGLATTPTTEMAVTAEKADGGLILTASHNPIQWNALKLLNRDGEFFDKATGERVLAIAEKGNFQYAEVHDLGHITEKDYTDYHIEQVLNLKLVNKDAIEKANFTVMCDCINSVGGIVIPRLLKALGVKQVYELNCTPNGQFAHTPEPIPQNLTQISGEMKQKKADIGFVVDPDVDRLALICENGEMFGEEYTLVSVADYVLQHTPGNTVSNLSSSRALRDVTRARGGQYNAAAVGEVNVVAKMKETNAVIGGEGNGGVIYPEIHYGRDALVGVALFLTQLALLRQQNPKLTISELRATYPPYCIAKQRIDLTPDIDIDKLLNTVKTEYSKLPDTEISDIDGVKIDFTDRWVHLRKSNTEPIIRVYAEAATEELAQQTADSVMQEVIKMKQ
ncbi:MAG: phosphoglucosamine mutase [Bacteroidales bacterium]|nr:phosphoglucosamine mutase [Bacteroidales bacterium]